MIVLDTTTVSALMRPALNPLVVAWVDAQEAAEMHVTTITIMELWAGIEALPASRRRQDLESAFQGLVLTNFRNRIISFDYDAAIKTGELLATRRRSGRPAGTRDAQIAGIAISRGAAIATRNVRHFSDLAIEVINPTA